MKQLALINRLTPAEMSGISDILPDREPRLKGNSIIPVCEPVVGSKELQYVTQAVSSSWLSSAGDFVTRFESAFAATVSRTSYAFGVNSGTSALHLALCALGIGKGDEVIVPTFTMIASVNAISYTGATPVFIDADPGSWNMDVRKLERLITTKTKAVIAVHTYGLPADMDAIVKIAKRHGLWVVEDAAEAHGAEYKGKRVGSIGDVSAFSLYANKVITTGEGGVVATNRTEIAERLSLLRNHAFTSERHFWHSMVGFGYRMSNIQAAVGCAQVERFDSFMQKKRKIASAYRSALSGLPGIVLPEESEGLVHAYWMFGIMVDAQLFGMSKNKLRKHLADRGVETRSFFIPIHVQPPYFREFYKRKYPVSEHLCRDGLYLPSSVMLADSQLKAVVRAIRSAYRAGGRT